MGVGVVNAPETGGASVVATVAVGGAAGLLGNTTKQEIDMATGTQKHGFNVKEAAVATAAGAVTAGATHGLAPAKIPGLFSGRNSMNAVGKAARTKIANGNASGMSVKTAVKGAIGSQAADLQKNIGGAAIDAAKTKVCQHTDGGC